MKLSIETEICLHVPVLPSELTIPAPFNKTHYDWLLSVENDEPEEWELVLRSDDAHVEVWRKENTAPSLFKVLGVLLVIQLWAV